jgi:maleate isomerase
MQLLEHLPFELDAGLAPAGRVGLIMLASDHTIEAEFHAMFRHVPQLGLFGNRILNDDQVTPETLRAMEPRITASTAEILPSSEIDVVAFACTSASMAIGEENVFRRIREARPDVRCTTPITAAFQAFRAFGARRIAILTPYRADVNVIVADYVRARGFEVPVFGSFNEESDAAVGRISEASVRAGISRVIDGHDVDAVFVSCTSVRLADAVAGIEAEIGLPVTSSNHAMAWHAIRLAGVTQEIPQLGRLFTLAQPD